MTASRMSNYDFHWFGFDPIERDFRIGYETHGGKLPHASFSLCLMTGILVMGYHSRQTEARGENGRRRYCEKPLGAVNPY